MRRASGSKLPIVLPRNATTRRPPVGDRAEVVLEVADDGVHLDAARTRAAMSAADARSVASLTSKGAKRRSVPSLASASSSTRVFSDVPDPSSTSVSARVRAAMSPACSSRIERSVRVG